MLPNDPQLRLHEAQATMAMRQHESSQERLAAEARLVAAADPASRSAFEGDSHEDLHSCLTTVIFCLRVVIALSALLGALDAIHADQRRTAPPRDVVTACCSTSRRATSGCSRSTPPSTWDSGWPPAAGSPSPCRTALRALPAPVVSGRRGPSGGAAGRACPRRGSAGTSPRTWTRFSARRNGVPDRVSSWVSSGTRMSRTGPLLRAQDREQRLGLADGRPDVVLAVLDEQRRPDPVGVGERRDLAEVGRVAPTASPRTRAPPSRRR